MASRKLKKYGLSEEQYRSILERQDNRCAICRRPFEERRASIDHCHTCGMVRGILCFWCNRYMVSKNCYESASAVLAYLSQDTCEANTKWREHLADME